MIASLRLKTGLQYRSKSHLKSLSPVVPGRGLVSEIPPLRVSLTHSLTTAKLQGTGVRNQTVMALISYSYK